MAKFVKGDIVVVPFPFSDLTGSKKRPAMVLTSLPGDDILLCQITSQNPSGKFSVNITPIEFTEGSLPVDSNIRAEKIFTADTNIILRKAGHVSDFIIDKTISIIVGLLQ